MKLRAQRFFLVVSLCLSIFSCSNLSFNQRFERAGWDKIIIAPITGNYSEEVAKLVDHYLTTTNKLTVFPTSYIEDSVELNTSETPRADLKKFADLQGIDAILFIEISVDAPLNKRNYDLQAVKAEVFFKLVDSQTGLNVASSKNSSTSIFSDVNTVIENATVKGISDILNALEKVGK